MGITWIIGVLVIEVEELFALAYIFTIFVAFQGLFIFVIFVPLSKQVRENYLKWWKTKVAESDILSSYFGDKRQTQGTSPVSGHHHNTSLPGCLHQKSGKKPLLAQVNKSDIKKSEIFENSFIDDKSSMEKFSTESCPNERTM